MKGVIFVLIIYLINNSIILAQEQTNIKRLGFLIENPNCILIGNSCNNSIPCCEGLKCMVSNICQD
jgi:hypothetical protein